MTEDKRKKEERAARFGIVTKDVLDKKLQDRRERFGIETKETLEAKKQERMKRFGAPEKNGNGGKKNRDKESVREVSAPKEMDEERVKLLKERLERFGAVEKGGEIVERSVSNTGKGDRKRDRKNKQKKDVVINKKMEKKPQNSGAPKPQGNR